MDQSASPMPEVQPIPKKLFPEEEYAQKLASTAEETLRLTREIAGDMRIIQTHNPPLEPKSPFSWRSASITKISLALAKAQAAFTTIDKSKTAGKEGERFSYKYADLADVIRATVPALSANELTLTQPLVMEGGKQYLETVLLHSSGEWIKSTMEIGPMTDPKNFGSRLTYARRYNEQSILNVAAEEDLDGFTVPEAQSRQERPQNEGRGRGNTKQAGKQAQQPANKPEGAPATKPPAGKKDAPAGFAGGVVLTFGEHKGKKLDELNAEQLRLIELIYSGEDWQKDPAIKAFKVLWDRFVAARKKAEPTPHSEFAAAIKSSDWSKENLAKVSEHKYKTADSKALTVDQVVEFTKLVKRPYAEVAAELGL